MTMLICYDVSRDSARAKIAAYLQQWGDRIQRSVYICAIAPDKLTEVTNHLTTFIDPATDAVHILPACGTCWTRLVVLGQADREPDKPYWAAL
ncbi:CRISPR-associated endonuclease Cas2 [Actinophytocola sp. KF-1]